METIKDLELEKLQAIKLVSEFISYFGTCNLLDFKNDGDLKRVAIDAALIEVGNIIKLNVIKQDNMIDYWLEVREQILEL